MKGSLIAEAEYRAHLEAREDVRETHRKFARINRQNRFEWLDSEIEREKHREVIACVGGGRITMAKEPGYCLYENEARGMRQPCKGFSPRSRQAMLEFCASLKITALPLFVTLTYPDSWPEDWQTWKADLQTFFKRLRRKWKGASALWKLEPQEREAPHFHLLVWGVEFMPHEWLAQAWYECVGSNDERHLHAGTSVERAESFNGVMAYCSKNYLGKTVELPPSWENVGRFWGVMGRPHAPKAPQARMRVGKGQAFKFRRLIRKHLRVSAKKTHRLACAAALAKGKPSPKWKKDRRAVIRGHLGRCTLFTTSILEWVRALDWCGGCETVPRHLNVPLEACPF